MSADRHVCQRKADKDERGEQDPNGHGRGRRGGNRQIPAGATSRPIEGEESQDDAAETRRQDQGFCELEAFTALHLGTRCGKHPGERHDQANRRKRFRPLLLLQ